MLKRVKNARNIPLINIKQTNMSYKNSTFYLFYDSNKIVWKYILSNICFIISRRIRFIVLGMHAVFLSEREMLEVDSLDSDYFH